MTGGLVDWQGRHYQCFSCMLTATVDEPLCIISLRFCDVMFISDQTPARSVLMLGPNQSDHWLRVLALACRCLISKQSLQDYCTAYLYPAFDHVQRLNMPSSTNMFLQWLCWLSGLPVISTYRSSRIWHPDLHDLRPQVCQSSPRHCHVIFVSCVGPAGWLLLLS